MKSEDKEMSKPVANQDTGYKTSICPEFSRLHLHVKWDLDLQDFQAVETRERLSRDVREAVSRETPASQRGGPVGDAGREPGRAVALGQHPGPWEGGWWCNCTANCTMTLQGAH